MKEIYLKNKSIRYGKTIQKLFLFTLFFQQKNIVGEAVKNNTISNKTKGPFVFRYINCNDISITGHDCKNSSNLLLNKFDSTYFKFQNAQTLKENNEMLKPKVASNIKSISIADKYTKASIDFNILIKNCRINSNIYYRENSKAIMVIKYYNKNKDSIVETIGSLSCVFTVIIRKLQGSILRIHLTVLWKQNLELLEKIAHIIDNEIIEELIIYAHEFKNLKSSFVNILEEYSDQCIFGYTEVNEYSEDDSEINRLLDELGI